MLKFKNNIYEVTAEIDGWWVTKQIESEVMLPKEEIAKLGYDLFGSNAKLIGYKVRID